jgi:hypothetical protein
MKIRRLAFTLIFAAALALPLPGFAETKSATKLLGTFGGWKAYSYGTKDEPVCYMTLGTHFPPSKKFKREASFLMITHRPSENSKNVVSYVAGYNFKTTSEVTIELGKKSFDLFTQKDTAWSRDGATDHALALAIRDGASLKLTGTPSAKGAAPITDTLNLKGAAAAYAAIGKACGVSEPIPKPAAKKPVKSTH